MRLLLENWREYLDEIDERPPIPGLNTPKGKQDSVDYFWFDHAASMEKDGKAGEGTDRRLGRLSGNTL